MGFQNIIVERQEHIGIVTFNRPKAYNALNTDMLKEIEQAIIDLCEDKLINVVVFTGAEKAFIAGADINEMANMNEEEARAYGTFGAKVFRDIERMKKPTIAAINGFCLGGGNELALACDLRIASTKAKFGQPEVTLGITPGFSGTQRLPRLIGIAKAKELLYTGKVIDTEEATEIGLVNEVVAHQDLMCHTLKLAKTISKNAQLAIRAVKQQVNRGLEVLMDEAIEIETDYFAKCFVTKDQKEGMKAFLEKRAADFKSE